MIQNISIGPVDEAAFSNRMDVCVGTGRMGLALQKEYMDELALAQEKIGFSFIRGHGLFCDDMGIFNAYQDENGRRQIAYNFTYLDRVMDGYLALGIRPFLELGFMPAQLASGTQTVFYWKGNVTPPKDESEWVNLVRALISHLITRCGEAEVASWPVEVWNGPNLAGFWENADLDKYLRLYEITANAVKDALPAMRVGGPSVCGLDNCHHWIETFLKYCDEKSVPLDFVTRHAYMAEAPTRQGQYVYHPMRTVDDLMNEMLETRRLIDSFPAFCGMEMHITEFNTSYSPRCPIHDTNYNAAIVAGLLSRLGDVAASYSYWTFGDVFEETGVPFTLFHGGFGLVAGGLIEKPTFWAFAFFKRLTGKCVHRSENAVVVRMGDGGYRGVCWQILGDEEIAINLSLSAKDPRYALLTRRVDEETCNPRKAWHDMGQPQSPTAEQVAFIKACASPLSKTEQVSANGGEARISLAVKPNGLVYFELCPVCQMNDYGFDYDWYAGR